MNYPKLFVAIRKSTVLFVGASAVVSLPLYLAGIGSGFSAFAVIFGYLFIALVYSLYRYD